MEAQLEDLVHELITVSEHVRVNTFPHLRVQSAGRAASGLDLLKIDACGRAAGPDTALRAPRGVRCRVDAWSRDGPYLEYHSNGSEDSERCQSTYTDKLDVSRGQSSCNDEHNYSQELERDGPYSEFNSNGSEDSRRGQSTCTDTHSDSQELERDGPYSDYDDTSVSGI